MLDPVTLDQLRIFVTVVEAGNFSAAARKLKRVQSAVSTSMSNFESQLGVRIWDRSTKVAQLTREGRVLLGTAQRVLEEMDVLRRVAAAMTSGLEAQVSLCVDSLFPVDALVDLCVRFAKRFAEVELRVDTQTMSVVSTRVLEGVATLGVASPRGVHPTLESTALGAIQMVPVVASGHPLARYKGKLTTSQLARNVQIVLSERHEGSEAEAKRVGVRDQAVLSPRTWRVAELGVKHAMLRAGLGWGNLPDHLVREDLQTGRLVRIHPAAWGEDEHKLYFSAVYRKDLTFGPAHKWILDQLPELCS